MKSALVFQGVIKRYGRQRALDGLTLQVPAGCVMGLVGSNGAGKTTALTAAAGLVRIQAGSLDLLGAGPFDSRKHAGRISLLPQDALMPGHLTVQQFLRYLGRLQGIPRDKVNREIDGMLDWVNLADRKTSKIQALSHGMRRRVTIAQAFLGSPDLVLLDEPLNGLDPREVGNIRRLIRRKRPDQTLVVSSHLLNEVEAGCDEVAFMDKGICTRQDRLEHVTGSHQASRFLLGTDQVDVELLTTRLPGLNLSYDTETRTLNVSSRDAVLSAGGLNAQVLPVLLDHGIPILEIRQGIGLEDQYLKEHGNKG